MLDDFKGGKGFLRGIFSESDGTPSASRLIMAGLAVVAAAVVILLTVTIMKSDVSKASLILVALPGIIMSLAGFLASPYGVNAIRSAVASVAGALKGNQDQK